jgi:hypothetical protein
MASSRSREQSIYRQETDTSRNTLSSVISQALSTETWKGCVHRDLDTAILEGIPENLVTDPEIAECIGLESEDVEAEMENLGLESR